MKNRLARRRKRMWLEDPHCENCGILTVLPEHIKMGKKKRQPPNMATIQHKYHRLHPLRMVRTDDRRTYLWCRSCNTKDNLEVLAKMNRHSTIYRIACYIKEFFLLLFRIKQVTNKK